MGFHGPNVVTCEVITRKWTLLIGAYLPNSALEHLPDLAEALTCFWKQETIMLGDLNDDIQDQNYRIQQVTEQMM